MGKKTNWTSAEDHTLCRVWLSASDLQFHNGDQKASNFWNVVRELFHQEVETAVERPLNGLKVRWTRINRDSQKFAGVLNEIQHKGMRQTEESGGDSGDAAAVALLTEQQWIDEAKDIFQRIYNSKFSFESCWKQLRYSNKWMQLYANSCSNPELAMNALSTAVVTQEENRARASSTTSSEKEEEITTDNAATTPPPAPSQSPRSQETTSSVAAVNQAAPETNTFVIPSSHKRRADVSLESFAHVQNQNQLQSLTTTLIEELKRQNDLMEDQNAIALLKIDGETISDEEARHCYQLLQARYLKKARTNGYNARTSTLVLMETKDVADAVANIRRYWGSDHEYTDEELFAIAQHQWEDARGSGNAMKDFVLQVVACRLEEQLLLWLLQPHAADAAEDLQKLFDVCADFTTEGLELLESILDSLLTATIVRAVACDRNAENRKRRITEIAERMEGKVFLKSKTRSILRTLEKCEMNTEGVGVWPKFLELPNVLDSRVFNSRSGRTFMDEAGQVIALQQAELAAVRRFIDDEVLEGEQKLIAGVFWDLATQIIELIKANTDSSDTTEGTMDTGIDSVLVRVENVTDLEKYLKAKESLASTCANGSSEIELNLDEEEVELSAIKQLSSICSSSKEPLISSGILDKVFDELSAMKNLDVISIHASFLLGMQMRLHCCFVDHCDSAKEEFERRIRRIFNRLTNKGKGLEHAAQLVILSAFCPGPIIQQCLRGAQTDVLHHSLYLNVLRASPLLLDWNEVAENEAVTLLECELQQTLLDIARDQSKFDREGHNLLSFLLSLVEVNNTSSKRGTPVMTITKLLDRVVNPIFCCSGENLEIQQNFLTLIQQFCQHLVAANADLNIESAVLKTSFDVCLAALCSMNASDPRLGVVREKLLLLLKNIMELMDDPVSTIMLEKLDSPLNPSLWTLISLFNSELGNDELCNGLEDVTTIEVYLQEKYEDGSLTPLPLPNVISAIQVLLWGLLWDSTLLENVSVDSTKAETWRLLHSVAGYEFLGSDSGVQPIKGSLLIQSAVAEMMHECGSVLFQALLSNIIPYLLEYESTEFSVEDRLSVPKWAADKLSEQPEIELQIPCRLVSTHVIMRYVAKCWGLSGAVNIQLATPSNVLLVESLSHVLVTQDQAITSSQGSLSGTLFCIQWLCFLVSAACELQLDALSTWHVIQTQLEISLLRSLHQLDQLKGITAAEARFSQYFVAVWLAYLPAGQFEQVFYFIGSRTNN